MTHGWQYDESDPDRGGGRVGATTVLPIVRAAMARGEGPPAVLDWVRRHGDPATRRPGWTATDEARARVLAALLAARFGRWRRAAAETGRPGPPVGYSTLGPFHADANEPRREER